MATATINETQIEKYLRLKKEQLETVWNAEGKVNVYATEAEEGTNFSIVVRGKYRKTLGATCQINKQDAEMSLDGYFKYVQIMFEYMEKSITEKIIYLFFNCESKKS